MRELMQATFELDDAAAPFVFLRVPESPPRELFGEALAATEARLAGATDRVILVVDLQRVRIMSTRVRTELGAWLQRVDPVLRTRVVGLVFVFLTPSVRAGLAALFWLRAPSYPVAVVGSLAEALAWGERRWDERTL